MSEGSNRTPQARRARVQVLKRLIILTLVLLVTIPCVCCVLLLVRVHSLDRKIQQMTEQMEKVNRVLEEMGRPGYAGSGEQDVSGEGTVPVNGAAPGGGTGAAPESHEAQRALEALQSTVESQNPGTLQYPEAQETVSRKVYLTFDDGPSMYTEDILDILDQYEVKATFFAVGKEDEASRERLRQIVERGHTLGMHSYSHEYGTLYASEESFAEDFVRIQDYLYEVTGVKSTLYRFPGGSSNTVSRVDMSELADYLEEQGVTFFDWNVSSGDGGRTLLTVQQLVDNCTKDLDQWNEAVILMHDSADKRTTVEALPIIIEKIQAMENTEILPITEDTEAIQHIHIAETKVKE